MESAESRLAAANKLNDDLIITPLLRGVRLELCGEGARVSKYITWRALDSAKADPIPLLVSDMRKSLQAPA